MNRTVSSESVDSLYQALQEQLKDYESKPITNSPVLTPEDDANVSPSSSQKTIQTSEVSTQTSSSPMFLHERNDDNEEEEEDGHSHYPNAMSIDTSPMSAVEMIDLTSPSPSLRSCACVDQTETMYLDSSPLELSPK